jgi:hypothetical protein
MLHCTEVLSRYGRGSVKVRQTAQAGLLPLLLLLWQWRRGLYLRKTMSPTNAAVEARTMKTRTRGLTT